MNFTAFPFWTQVATGIVAACTSGDLWFQRADLPPRVEVQDVFHVWMGAAERAESSRYEDGPDAWLTLTNRVAAWSAAPDPDAPTNGWLSYSLVYSNDTPIAEAVATNQYIPGSGWDLSEEQQMLRPGGTYRTCPPNFGVTVVEDTGDQCWWGVHEYIDVTSTNLGVAPGRFWFSEIVLSPMKSQWVSLFFPPLAWSRPLVVYTNSATNLFVDSGAFMGVAATTDETPIYTTAYRFSDISWPSTYTVHSSWATLLLGGFLDYEPLAASLDCRFPGRFFPPYWVDLDSATAHPVRTLEIGGVSFGPLSTNHFSTAPVMTETHCRNAFLPTRPLGMLRNPIVTGNNLMWEEITALLVGKPHLRNFVLPCPDYTAIAVSNLTPQTDQALIRDDFWLDRGTNATFSFHGQTDPLPTLTVSQLWAAAGIPAGTNRFGDMHPSATYRPYGWMTRGDPVWTNDLQQRRDVMAPMQAHYVPYPARPFTNLVYHFEGRGTSYVSWADARAEAEASAATSTASRLYYCQKTIGRYADVYARWEAWIISRCPAPVVSGLSTQVAGSVDFYMRAGLPSPTWFYQTLGTNEWDVNDTQLLAPSGETQYWTRVNEAIPIVSGVATGAVVGVATSSVPAWCEDPFNYTSNLAGQVHYALTVKGWEVDSGYPYDTEGVLLWDYQYCTTNGL